jgi:hypothetical protein
MHRHPVYKLPSFDRLQTNKHFAHGSLCVAGLPGTLPPPVLYTKSYFFPYSDKYRIINVDGDGRLENSEKIKPVLTESAKELAEKKPSLIKKEVENKAVNELVEPEKFRAVKMTSSELEQLHQLNAEPITPTKRRRILKHNFSLID